MEYFLLCFSTLNLCPLEAPVSGWEAEQALSLPALLMNPFNWLGGNVVQLIFSCRIYKVFFSHLSLSSDNTGCIKLYKNDITRSIIMSLSLVLST